MKRKLRILAVCILCALLAAVPAVKGYAAKGGKNISVQLKIGKKTVTEQTYSMKEKTTKTIKVKASKVTSVKYSSSNKKVASVSKKGVVKAKKAETAKINVTVKTRQGSKKTWVKVKVSAAEPAPEHPDAGGSRILVAYFSRTGNTEAVADIICDKTGGKKVRIETVKAYPSDYDTLLDVVMQELESDARPELKTTVDMGEYDTVFIGYPIWHGDAPMAVRSFLEKYDFTGKMVIPFCTSGSSRPDTSFAHVKESAKGAKVPDGFWTGSSGLGKIHETVPQWLDGLEISESGSGKETGGI